MLLWHVANHTSHHESSGSHSRPRPAWFVLHFRRPFAPRDEIATTLHVEQPSLELVVSASLSRWGESAAVFKKGLKAQLSSGSRLSSVCCEGRRAFEACSICFGGHLAEVHAPNSTTRSFSSGILKFSQAAEP